MDAKFIERENVTTFFYYIISHHLTVRARADCGEDSPRGVRNLSTEATSGVTAVKQTDDFYKPRWFLCQRGAAYRRGGILSRSLVALASSSPVLRPLPFLKAAVAAAAAAVAVFKAGGGSRRGFGTREGSVPRIIGFKFLEEPQTNWRTVDTEKVLGLEPAPGFTRDSVGSRTHTVNETGTHVHIDRDTRCVTIPVS